MSRIGVANFVHSTDHDVKSTMYWKEVVGKDLRGHEHSVFNHPFPTNSYAFATTTSKETLGRTWKTLTDARTMAAGKGSFHYNVAKPPGAVRASATTASFERRPLPRGPLDGYMASSYGGHGYAPTAPMRRSVSAASPEILSVHHATTISPAAAAAAAAVLGGSSSSPVLTPLPSRRGYDWDGRSGRSSVASSRRSRGR
eukprot:TRINITY_DN118073_c0_g1_i1.p1 TRINITY_DN118073_c0_g1~~TRINITY_DN118073_c0_g1_i1.p1  ORF type:complete len:199 (+),score=30.54 TRINITY_DN118073_c0_g1_i1:80-676(+)